jgi:8-amino-7-oxononanoate synthase
VLLVKRRLLARLEGLDTAGLRRRPALPRDAAAPSFCSNDYLGLAGDDGAGASRLVDGERAAHQALEATFARFVGVEAALAFTSGYAANVGALSALIEPGDVVISDALNHASLIDGIRLARAATEVVPHNNLEAVAAALATHRGRQSWVVVESYYSMDADGPDLGHLRAICDDANASLVVDEAHALGVLGPSGRGRCAEARVRPDVLIGTLGKSFGSQGAVVGGVSELREWLWNRARSFVFSTGLSPAAASAGAAAIERSLTDEQLRERTLQNASHIREALARIDGLKVLGFGHVIPVVTPNALAVSQRLAERGIHLPAIRPPTVPANTARLRITATAHQTPQSIDRLAEAIEWAHTLTR